MSIAAGSRLGPYRVDTLIGEGGMGQVYRGADTRLDRIVAIKVLPGHLSSHPQFRERFEREARAISSLSHPNICTLFDVGQHEGIEYLVMEYLDGESLADRLSRSPLPLDQVIRYGSQIAHALARAHQQGVVHRDLKPGNVMLSKSDAKLLDFGLARTAAAASSGATEDAPTKAWKPLTEEGAVLGTFQYMSPEQLEGREADARSDIFALGVLLYEMTTGKRAFEGKSRASLIASILDREPPPIASLQPAAPAALDHLIRACMAKDPDARLQSAHDAALQLEWIRDSAADAPITSSGRNRRWLLPAVVALALLAGAGLTALFQRGDDGRATGAVNLAFLPPPGYEMGGASLSRQGAIAFIAEDSTGQAHLFTRTLEDPVPRRLIEVWSIAPPFWSPDGKWIAFFDRNRLMKVQASGGQAEKICDSSYGMGGTWGEDGTIVFTPGYFQPLHTVSAAGGTSKPLTRLDAGRLEAVHAWPQILPDGDGVLYLAVGAPTQRARIMHVSIDGKSSSEVIAADAIAGYSAPFLLFVRDANLYAVRFDSETATASGEPRRVAEQLAYSSSQNSANASVTPEGILMFPAQVREKRRLVWYDRAGRSLGVVLEDDDISRQTLSPDGKRILFSKWIFDRGTLGVYSFDVERGVTTLLTQGPAFGWHPVWFPEGDRFAFSTARASSVIDLYTQLDDPQAAPEPLWVSNDGDDKQALGFTPDGQYLLAMEYTPSHLYDIWLVPVNGKGERKKLVATEASEHAADISGDGRWLAFTAGAFLSGSRTAEIYVRRMDGGRSARVSTAGGAVPKWSADGRELFYIAPDMTMMRAAFDPVTGTVGVPELLFRLEHGTSNGFDLSADGDKFLINEPVSASRSVRSFNVVTGWKAALETE